MDDTRQCPYCRGLMPLGIEICPFCNRSSEASDALPNSPPDWKGVLIGVALAAAVLGLAFLLR